MADWQIIVDDEGPRPSPAMPPHPPNAAPSRQKLIWIGLILIVLTIIGGLALHEQRRSNRAAMRRDLTAVIFEEETVRQQGDPDRAADFAIAQPPSTWWQAYRQTFSLQIDSPPSGGSVEIKQLEFDGSCAVVDLVIDDLEQVRAYCLEATHWRRAPVPATAWNDQQTLTLRDGLHIRFSIRDQDVAQTLAVDTLTLLNNVERSWPYAPDLEIVIEPHDLQPPLVSSDGDRIHLNSPRLIPPTGDLSPSEAVRLASAEALLGQFSPIRLSLASELPNSDRFRAAAQRIIAAHSVLPAAAQESLLAEWRDQLEGAWVSPFFAEVLTPEASATQAGAAALILADYIYRLQGIEGMIQTLEQQSGKRDWDQIFQPTLGRSTIVLETEAAFYARTSAEMTPTFRPLLTISDTLVPPPLPLTATLQRAEGRQAVVQLPDQTTPVWVQLPEQLNASDGTPVPAGCLPPDSSLRLDGEWREVRQRLRATQARVTAVRPLDLNGADEMMAYIISGEPFAEQEAILDGPVYPGTRSYLQARRARVAEALLAVDRQGDLHHLTPLSETLRLFPLPMGADTPHFLFRHSLPGCERDWFVHYEPRQGVIGHWLAPNPETRWVWRTDLDRPLFFERRENSPGDNIYQADRLFSHDLIGQTNASMFFLGWSLDREQLIGTNAWFGEMYLGPLDWASGYIDRSAHPSYRPLRQARLSPDGRWMAHLGGLKNMLGPADRLDVLDLTKGTERTLLQLEAGQGVGAAVWSLDVTRPAQLAVLSGPVTADGDDFLPTRLLLASPAQPRAIRVAAEANAGEHLTTPVFCADGSLLYRTRQNGLYRLYRQWPAQPPRLLLERERSFWPLGC